MDKQRKNQNPGAAAMELDRYKLTIMLKWFDIWIWAQHLLPLELYSE